VDDAKRRAWAALGLGPLWRPRAGAPDAPAEPPTDALGDPTAADDPTAARRMDWPALQAAVAACTACGLCRTRTRTVFGVGPQPAPWMLIGEAPGAEEDVRGEPFVGQAGRLLDQMLASIGVERGRDAFIANVLKCRPPGNRDPSPAEVARCAPFLARQVELVQPRIIVLLGRFAAQTMLQTDASIASLRGRVHRRSFGAREVPMVVTYHPAYLLRSLSEKSRAWADLCLAREVFEAAAVDAAALDAAAVDMAAVDTAAVDTAAVAGRPAPTASTDGQH
jgi:DNA polymerase